MQITYSNGSIFIRFSSGNTLLAPCTKALASEILTMDENEVEITALLYPDFKEAFEDYTKKATENQFLETLNHERFEFKEGKLYRKGIPLSIPKVLADKIREAITNNDEKELSKLEKFWGWSSLIRSAESRESFFSYVKNNDLLITNQGLVIGFRRAYFKGANNADLIKFVTQTYLKKRAAKKSTNVDIWGCKHNNNFSISSDGSEHNSPYYVGNLKELFHSLHSEDNGYFESWHKNLFTNKPEKYFIGKETKLPIEQCNLDPKVSCGAGLHFGGRSYSMDGYGDTPIAFVFNPMTLLACPNNYDTGRCQAQTFLCALNKDREFELTDEMSTIIDEIYGDSVQFLEEQITKSDFEEWSKGHTLLNELGELDIKSMFTNVKNVITPPDLSNKVVKL